MQKFFNLYKVLGISIIIGILVGLTFSKTKYYSHQRYKKKIEVHKDFYKEAREYKSTSVNFNLQYGLISGFLTFGIGLTIIGSKKKNSEVFK